MPDVERFEDAADYAAWVAASMLNWPTPWVVTLDGEVVPAAYAVERGLDGYACYNRHMAGAVARALRTSERAADATWLAWLREVRDDLRDGRTPEAWKERIGWLRRDGYTPEQVEAIIRGELRRRRGPQRRR